MLSYKIEPVKKIFKKGLTNMDSSCIVLTGSRQLKEVNNVPDKNESLQSLGAAWNEMDDVTRVALISFGEGYLAGKQAQAEAGA